MWILVVVALLGAVETTVEIGEYPTFMECAAAREIKIAQYIREGANFEAMRCRPPLYPGG